MKRIPIKDIDGSMQIMRFDKSGISFAYYGRLIPFNAIEIVKTHLINAGIQFAYIKSDEDKNAPRAGNSIDYASLMEETLARSYSPVSDISLPGVEDIVAAQKIHSSAKKITKHLLSEVRLGNAVNTDTAKLVVNDLMTSCFKNPEAFVNMTRLKDFDDYTFTHSVNVSVLSISIGKRLGMSSNDLALLGLAALLHDIGKMQVPENILNKPGRLTEEELLVMHNHTVFGYNILKQDSSIPPEVVSACRQHHEKSDGSGYPDGLKEAEISKFAKIISISDVYDAITSERVYHKSMIAHDALKLLFSWSGKHFNEVLVKFFINLIGIYPVGSIVLLDSGEMGVVIEPNKRDSKKPKVIIFSNAQKQRVKLWLYDLTAYNVTNGIPYKNILATLKKEDLQIEPNELIEQYLKSNTGYTRSAKADSFDIS